MFAIRRYTLESLTMSTTAGSDAKQRRAAFVSTCFQRVSEHRFQAGSSAMPAAAATAGSANINAHTA